MLNIQLSDMFPQEETGSIGSQRPRFIFRSAKNTVAWPSRPRVATTTLAIHRCCLWQADKFAFEDQSRMGFCVLAIFFDQLAKWCKMRREIEFKLNSISYMDVYGSIIPKRSKGVVCRVFLVRAVLRRRGADHRQSLLSGMGRPLNGPIFASLPCWASPDVQIRFR